MVCQAASQTNFRALKHENGIAGSSTIIVRVIACFQPLQDCQIQVNSRIYYCRNPSGDSFGWMGEDWRTSFPQHPSPNLNYLGAPLSVEHHHTIPSLVNPGSNMVSIKGTIPVYPSLEPPYTCVGQGHEPHGWFYCLPQFRQAFMPDLNSGFKEKLPTAPYGNKKVDSGCSQKRFLVFDQSGDQTTLIFSSGTGSPAPCFTSWGPKPTGACNLKREDPETKENLNIHLRAIAADHFGKNDGADSQSEMHEDTDELNALLYSDDDSDYTEGDEVTSTGHSPSTMTAHNDQDWFKGSTEEVASSGGSTKKRKLFDGGFSDVPALMDTASSVKPCRSFEHEDDAESRCDDDRLYRVSGEMGSESSNKKMRKERIRDTVSILRNIIPGSKGKDAIVVIDEAISYLKSLKHKAKALGLDAP